MTKHTQSFTVGIDGELIVVTRLGVQTAESVNAIRQEVERIMKSRGKPTDMLVLAKSTSLPDESAVQASIQNLKEIPYRRVAIVGTIPQRLVTAKGIMKASNVGDNVKIFRSEEDARAWLEEH